MNRIIKAVLISELLTRMIARDSWAGETHLQKCMFFLQRMRGVPTDYSFLLYRYGPFSFGLRDDLVQLQGDGLVELSPRPYPYGPTLTASEASQRFRKLCSKTLEKYDDDLNFVADHFGSMTASELEKFATAYYFHLRELSSSDEDIAKKVNAVKPHISVSEGVKATQEIRGIAAMTRSE